MNFIYKKYQIYLQCLILKRKNDFNKISSDFIFWQFDSFQLLLQTLVLLLQNLVLLHLADEQSLSVGQLFLEELNLEKEMIKY